MGTVDLVDMAKVLDLEVVYMAQNHNVDIPNSNFNRPGLQLSGYFDHYAMKRSQVIGNAEMKYISSFDEQEQRRKIDEYFSHGMPFLVITRGLEIPKCMVETAKKYDISLFRSKNPTTAFVQTMMSYLDDQLMPVTVVHGVMLDIFGHGVLIMGQSGIGKSETALELIDRGSRLVADDAVQIQRKSDDRLVAQAPELIKHFMEIRGIGIIDAKAMFGIGSVVDKKEVDLVVKLENWNPEKSYERLGMNREYHEILGVNVPCVTIPVRPGRNMAAVLEVAARNERLRSAGYYAAEVLNERIIKSNKEKEKN